MSREKFVYNTHTLRYEKHVEPLRYKLLKGFGILCALALTAFFISLALQPLMPSAIEKDQARQISMLSSTIDVMSEDLSSMEKVLANIQERDASVHRMMFGIDPIDDGVWNGGIGGHDVYAGLPENARNNSELKNVQSRINRLKRQLAMQSESLDTISYFANNHERMLASVPSITPIRSDKLARGIRLLSGFGMRLHPIHKVRKMHQGIDFTSPVGTPIYATGDGKVVKSEKKRTGYGYHVVISHGYGYETLYGHMSKIMVRPGQKVKKGEQIGKVGSTGSSTAPHCHYEVHLNGNAINPIHYCQDDLTVEEYQTLVNNTAQSNQSFD